MKKKQAFTLIEITISLTVFFIIITIILTTSKNIFLNQKQIASHISKKQTITTLLNTISLQIKSIYSDKEFPISGNKDQLIFYTLHSNTSTPPLCVKYYNNNQNIKCQKQEYLSTKKTDLISAQNMQISFSYLTKDNMATENASKDADIKAIKIEIKCDNNNYSRIIKINRD